MKLGLLYGVLFLGNFVFGQSQEYLFIPNQNQWEPVVNYKATVPGGYIYLEEQGITYQFLDYSEVLALHHNPGKKVRKPPVIKQHVIKTHFIGSNKRVKTTHSGESSIYYNYYIGNDKNRWASNVHGYDMVTYQNLYDGIDLKFRTQSYDLKYDLIVAPYTDPSVIRIEYQGANKLYLKRGELHIETSLGKISEQKTVCLSNDQRKGQVRCLSL